MWPGTPSLETWIFSTKTYGGRRAARRASMILTTGTTMMGVKMIPQVQGQQGPRPQLLHLWAPDPLSPYEGGFLLSFSGAPSPHHLVQMRAVSFSAHWTSRQEQIAPETKQVPKVARSTTNDCSCSLAAIWALHFAICICQTMALESRSPFLSRCVLMHHFIAPQRWPVGGTT